MCPGATRRWNGSSNTCEIVRSGSRACATRPESDPLTAYAWLAFICGTSDGVRMTLDGVLAPVGAMRDLPLLLFKQATCFGLDRMKLEALMTRDTRFVEASFLLGQIAGGQRLLDEAETFYEQAYAWHPRWPILTLSIGAVALTAEEFDRSLEFYLETLELEPRAAEALLGKTRALTYCEQHEPAIVVADQLIGEGWLPGDAYYWKALNETQLGRLEAAWVDIEKADKLLFNDQVPKLAGTIAYRRMELAVARAKFEEARRRNPDDCETGFYLGIVLADLRVWDRTADVFVATVRCLENAEQEYHAGHREDQRVEGHAGQAGAADREARAADRRRPPDDGHLVVQHGGGVLQPLPEGRRPAVRRETRRRRAVRGPRPRDPFVREVGTQDPSPRARPSPSVRFTDTAIARLRDRPCLRCM